jgi:hypothetical protein
MMRRKLGSLAIGVISLAAASTVRVDGETSSRHTQLSRHDPRSGGRVPNH